MIYSFYPNPYHDLTFFEFFIEWIKRMLSFIMGRLPVNQLASDEIQIFVLIGVSISCALIGSFLILRRMTMLANSLSHTVLIGIVLAYVLTNSQTHEGAGPMIAPMGAMLIASLATGFLTAFLTEFLTKVGRLQEDASTGLVFTSLFALGVILVTVLTRDAHIGTEAVMGNVDALNINDVFWVYVIAAVNLGLIVLFFKEYQLTTFDSAFAAALGFSPFIFNYLLMAQVSMTTIASFRAVGVLLVLGFITGPFLIARQFTHRLKYLLLLSVFIGCLDVLIGVALTRHLLSVYGVALSTSGVVISVLFLMVLASFVKASPFKIDFFANSAILTDSTLSNR